MKDISNALLAVFAGILALAMASVLISRKSQTPDVIQSAATALAKVISAAVTPVAPAANSGNVGGTAGGVPTQAAGTSFWSGLLHYSPW